MSAHTHTHAHAHTHTHIYIYCNDVAVNVLISTAMITIYHRYYR